MMIAVISTGDLAQKADAEQVDGEDLGAESLELIGALIGEHDADQEGEKPDDRQGIDAGFFDLVKQRSDAQVSARMIDRLQPLKRDAADITEDSGALIDAVDRSLADTLDEGFQCVPVMDDDRRRCVLMLDRVQQRIVHVRQQDRSDFPACAFPLALGANQEPRPRAVDPLQRRAVDLRFGGVAELKRAKLDVQLGRVLCGPLALDHQTK